MRILAIETSTDTGSVALLEDGAIIAEKSLRAPMQLLSWLAPAISEILEETGIPLNKIDAIATGIGPGSFTGVRLELATAKTLAQAARLPLYSVSSLDALAFQALPFQGTIIACLDAKRSELYVGLYRADRDKLEVARDYLCLSRENLVNEALKLPPPYLLIGETHPHTSFFLDHLPQSQEAAPSKSVVLASATAVLAEKRTGAQSGDLYGISPLYIRLSQAEIEHAGKHKV